MSRSRDLANLANNATGLETITVSDITDLTATATELNKLDGVTATTAELNYVDGVGSALQTQIDAKLGTSGTFNGTIGSSATFPAGHVLQVVSGVDTDGTTCSSGDSSSFSFTDCVTVSITPQSGTKILVLVDAQYGTANDSSYAVLRVLRDSTILDYNTTASYNHHSTHAVTVWNVTEGYNRAIYDTHGADGSTAITYKLQLARATTGYNTFVGRCYDNPTSFTYRSAQATRITALEVSS